MDSGVLLRHSVTGMAGWAEDEPSAQLVEKLVPEVDEGTLVSTTTVLPWYFEDGDFATMDQRSVPWADIDNDGDIDLLLASVVSQFDYLPTCSERDVLDLAAAKPRERTRVHLW